MAEKLIIPDSIKDSVVTPPPTEPVQPGKFVIPLKVAELYNENVDNIAKIKPAANTQQQFAGVVPTANPVISDNSTWDQAYNNFMAAKDGMELQTWKGMELQADEDPDSFSGVIKSAAALLGSPDFFQKRIADNLADYTKEINRIAYDPKAGEVNFTDVFNDPKSFFGTQLPNTLGSMAGLMMEPMIAAAAVGTIASYGLGIGEVGTGIIAGVTAIAASRPFESIAEGFGAYDEAYTELKSKFPHEDDQLLRSKAMEAFNYTYSKNLALSIADAGEIALAFLPLGTFAKGAISSTGRAGKFARRVNMFSQAHPFIDAAARTAIITQKEGLEEVYQQKLQNEGVNAAVEGDRPDSWVELFHDPSTLSQYKGGMLGGLALGGGAQILKGAAKAMKIVKDDIDTKPYEEIKNEQIDLRSAVIANAVYNGKEDDLMQAINKLGRTGQMADVATSDKEAKNQSSIAKAIEYGDQVADKFKQVKILRQSYPDLHSNAITRLFQNNELIADYQEQLKLLSDKNVTDLPAITLTNEKILALNEQNSRIIAGKSDELEVEKKDGEEVATPGAAPTTPVAAKPKDKSKPIPRIPFKATAKSEVVKKQEESVPAGPQDAPLPDEVPPYVNKNSSENDDIDTKRKEVKAAIVKAGQGEGGQFFVTLLDGTKETAVRISLVGNELGIGNKGSTVDLSVIKKIENPDGEVLYNSESTDTKNILPWDQPGKKATATKIAQKVINQEELTADEKEIETKNKKQVTKKVKKLSKKAEKAKQTKLQLEETPAPVPEKTPTNEKPARSNKDIHDAAEKVLSNNGILNGEIEKAVGTGGTHVLKLNNQNQDEVKFYMYENTVPVGSKATLKLVKPGKNVPFSIKDEEGNWRFQYKINAPTYPSRIEVWSNGKYVGRAAYDNFKDAPKTETPVTKSKNNANARKKTQAIKNDPAFHQQQTTKADEEIVAAKQKLAVAQNSTQLRAANKALKKAELKKAAIESNPPKKIKKKTRPSNEAPKPDANKAADVINKISELESSNPDPKTLLERLSETIAKTKADAIAARKSKDKGSRGLGMGGSFTSHDVYIFTLDVVQTMLKAGITLQNALKKVKASIYQNKNLTKREKDENWKAAEHLMNQVGKTIIEASKGDKAAIQELLDVFGGNEKDVIENASMFNAYQRMEWMGRKVKFLWSGTKDGVEKIIKDNAGNELTIDRRISILLDHAKTQKPGETIRQLYERLEVNDLRENLLENTDEQLVSGHQYLSSIDKVNFIYIGNNHDGKLGVSLANGATEVKGLANQLRDQFSKQFRYFENKDGQPSADFYNEFYNEYLADYKAARKEVAANILNKDQSLYRAALDNLIKVQSDFLSELTGIDANYFTMFANHKEFLKASNKQYDDIYAHYKALNGYTVLDKFILKGTEPSKVNSMRGMEQFKKNFTKGIEQTNAKTGKTYYINQFQKLSNVAANNQGETISNSFTGINGKTKSSLIFKSGLTIDIDRLNNDPAIFNTDRVYYLDKKGNKVANPWVHKRKGTPVAVHYLDGLKNFRSQETVSSNELSDLDIKLNFLTMFVDSEQFAGKGNYLQFVEQQADDGNKMFVTADKYPLAEARKIAQLLHETTSNFRSIEQIKADARITKNQLAVLAKQIKTTDTLENLSEQFHLNFEINKFLINDFLQPETYKEGSKIEKNFKDYLSGKVKRKRDSKGIRFNQDILGKELRQVTIHDPRALVKIGKYLFSGNRNEGVELPDGLIFVRDTTGEKMTKASGIIYNWKGSFKTAYNKVNDDRSTTFNKANSVVLSREFADSIASVHGDNTLQVIHQYMHDNNIDFFAFKSSVKQIRDSKVIRGKWKTTEAGNSTLQGLPAFNEQHVENIDTNYLVLQQDLQYTTELRDRNITKQLKYYFMQFESAPKMIELFNRIATKYKQEIEKDFFNQTDKAKIDWLKERIKDSPENYYLLNLLTSGQVNLYNPLIQERIQSIITSEIKTKVLNLITNGGITVEMPNVGVPLANFTKGETENTFAEGFVPADYQKSGLKEGDTVLVTRVPTTDLHSASIIKIKGFLPESMGSVIMTDAGTQKVAGADNDGDARYIWSYYRDENGNPINDETERGLANKILDLIHDEYKLPENYDRITRPIQTDAAEPIVNTYRATDANLNPNAVSSVIRAIQNNQEGQAVIGILARFNAVYAYAVKAGFKLPREIKFPVFSKEGKFQSSQPIHEWEDNDDIRFVLANNLNHATDNPKEGKLEYLGLTKATAVMKSMLIALGVSDEHATAFMQTSVIQDYIQESRNSESPFTDQNFRQIFDKLFKRYSSAIKDQATLDFYKNTRMNEKAYYNEAIISNDTPEGKIQLLYYFQNLKQIADEIYTINKVAKLLEEPPYRYSDYYDVKAAMDRLEIPHNNQGALRTNIGTLLESNLWNIAKDNMAIAEERFKNHILNSQYGKSVITELQKEFTLANGYNTTLTKEHIDTLETELTNYIAIESMQIAQTKSDIREEVKDWYETLPTNSPMSELFFFNYDERFNRVELRYNYRKMTDSGVVLQKFQQAFNNLTQYEKDLLVKYQLKEFGYTQNTEYRGGFSSIFDPTTNNNILNKIENTRKVLWSKKDFPAVVMDQLIANNPELVPEANWENSASTHHLVHKNSYNMKLRNNNQPKYLSAYKDGKTVIYKKHYLVDKKGVQSKILGYQDNSEQYSGNIEYDWRQKPGYTVNNLKGEHLKFQLDIKRDEPLASSDPELAEFIRTKLAAKFPAVELFTDKAKFEKLAGQGKVTLGYIGASIRNLAFVDPQKAVQSTQIHEYAHIYWDALPDGDLMKAALLQKLGSEEAAIEAIGKAGVNLAKQELAYNKDSWFVKWLKDFWEKVQKLFKISSPKDLATLFAERVLNNADNVTSESITANIMKFMQSPNLSRDSQVAVEGLKTLIKQNLDDLSLSDIISMMAPNDQEALKSAGIGETPIERNYYRINHEPMKFYENGRPVPMPIEKWYNTVFKTDIAYTELQPNSANYNDVQDKYKEYVNEYSTIYDRIWKKINKDSIVPTLRLTDKSRGNKSVDSITAMAQYLNSFKTIAANDAKAFINDLMFKASLTKMIKEEMENDQPNKPAIKFLYDVMNGGITNDWSNSTWISGNMSMISPSNVGESLLQLREVMHRDVRRQIEADQDTMRQLMKTAADKVNKLKSDWNKIVQSGDSIKNEIDDRFSPLNVMYFIKVPSQAILNDIERDSKIPHRQNNANLLKRIYNNYFTLKNSTNPADQALMEWLELHYKYEEMFNGYSRDKHSKRLKVPMVEADFPELQKRFGTQKAAQLYFAGEDRLDDITIETPGMSKPLMTLKEARTEVLSGAGRYMWSQVSAINKVRDLVETAKKQFKTGREANGMLITKDQVQRVSREIGFTFKEEATTNYGEAIKKYHDNLIEQRGLETLLPISMYVQDFYNRTNKQNIVTWLKNYDNKLFFKEDPASQFPAVAKAIDLFVSYTHWIQLGFNLLGAPFNASAGLLFSIRDIGLRRTLKGFRRLFTVSKDASFAGINQRAITIMKRLQIVNTSQDTEISTSNQLFKKFQNVVFSPITFVEYINHAYSFLGSMSNEEWERVSQLPITATANDYYNAIGDGDQQKGIRRVDALHETTQQINGSYSPFAKRGVNRTPEGRALMQFKNWLPDLVRAFFIPNTGSFKSGSEDLHGKIQKGLLNTILDKAVYKQFKDAKTPAAAKAAWDSLAEVDKHNLKRAFSQLIIGGMLAVMVAALEEDEEKKKKVQRALSDFTFVYDTNSLTFLAKGTVPIIDTITNLIKVVSETLHFSVGDGGTYEKNSQYHEKGDYRLPTYVLEVTPLKKALKLLRPDNESYNAND